MRLLLAMMILLALVGCGGKSATDQAFDAASSTATAHVIALGKADCSHLLIKGKSTDSVLRAAQAHAKTLSAEARADYLTGCRQAL